METPKRSYWFTAPRSALRNASNGLSSSVRDISNGQSDPFFRGPSSLNRHNTPSKESQRLLSASAKSLDLSIRRQLSKSHGDLSNLRPKSPPVKGSPAELHGLHLSPGNYVDDTQNFFSPTYNRQARQSIPNDWMAGASSNQALNAKERPPSAGQQIYRSPQHGLHDSYRVGSESATISIEGLTSGYIQPLAFCVPVTRFHPGDGDQRREALHGDAGRKVVEHISISTAWNGLSDVDAKELFRVHRAFVSTLENMLAPKLWQIYQQLQQQDFVGNIRPIQTLFSPGIVRGISFCRDQLVNRMAEALYCSEENVAKARSGFLRLYLMATDALVQHHDDGFRDTSITIRVRCGPLSLRSCPVVDAAWVPDFLMFEGLNGFATEGQSFSIVPRYCSKSAFRSTRLPQNVKYSIESESRHSLSWLAWDHEVAGFKGIVPFYSEVNGYDRQIAKTYVDPSEKFVKLLKIIVQAVLVDDNGSSVRYERILRARLTIKVLPYCANDNCCETKERLSELETYQDMRLACEDQCPREDSLRLNHSPIMLSQQNTEDHLYMSNECAQIGQIEVYKDSHLTKISSATGNGLQDTARDVQTPASRSQLMTLPSVDQTQAYLVAKCAKSTRDLEAVKEQFIMYGPSDVFHPRTLHGPHQQGPLHDSRRSFARQPGGQNGPASESSVRSISHHASELLSIPSSPSLNGRDSPIRVGPMARFSVLPPPAIDLTTRPTRESGTLNASNALEETCIDSDSIPAFSTDSHFVALEALRIQGLWTTREHNYIRRLPTQVPTYSNGISTAHPSLQRSSKPLIKPTARIKEATHPKSGQRGFKRRARSSLKETSPSKRTKDTGDQPEQDMVALNRDHGKDTLPLLDSEYVGFYAPIKRSNGIFYNSFDPLCNLKSSTTLTGEESLVLSHCEKQTSTNFGENSKHPNQDQGHCMAIGTTNDDELATQTSPANAVLDDRATVTEGVPSTQFFPGSEGKIRLRQSSSTSCLQCASIGSTTPSCSASSDIDFVVEQDARARKVSRREQARLWRLLSRSNTNKKSQSSPEGQEVRLSEDEKKAMDEAVQRSLDDLARGFDEIFLEESSESTSGNDI